MNPPVTAYMYAGLVYAVVVFTLALIVGDGYRDQRDTAELQVEATNELNRLLQLKRVEAFALRDMALEVAAMGAVSE